LRNESLRDDERAALIERMRNELPSCNMSFVHNFVNNEPSLGS
jgi:hypothetical protein